MRGELISLTKRKRELLNVLARRSFDDDVRNELVRIRALNRLIANYRGNKKCGTLFK